MQSHPLRLIEYVSGQEQPWEVLRALEVEVATNSRGDTGPARDSDLLHLTLLEKKESARLMRLTATPFERPIGDSSDDDEDEDGLEEIAKRLIIAEKKNR